VQPGSTLPNVSTGLNPHRYPAAALFLNFDVIGSEEGSYLYQSIYFAKDPILSVSLAATYQSQALRVVKGLTNQRSLTSTVFLDYPLSEQQELVFILGGYLYGNGTGSRDTGKGFSADLGFRYDFVRPYVTYEYFTSDDCPSDATAAQCVATTGFGQTGVHLADSRNFRAGLDFYINKVQNHFMVEFALNRGQSAFGPQSITVANAGYAPFVPAGQPALTSLARSPAKSLTMHWSLYF